MTTNWKNKLNLWAFAGLMTLAVTGCELRQSMYNQPKLRPLKASEFFEDGMASRPKIDGTVARGQLQEDTHLYEGRVNDQFVNSFPFEITAEVLKRGQERFNIYCAPCHDQAGTGNGMIVKRGFKKPPSYHDQRLVDAPEGYFYNVIKNGFGVMYDYSAQVPVNDRWAIIAYIRALQYSQRATLDDVPENLRTELQAQR